MNSYIKINPTKKYTNNELRELRIYGVIYKVTNDVNSKIYVGKTIDLRERIRGRKYEVKSNQLVSKNGIISAMREIGLDKFHYQIIDYLEVDSDFQYSNKEIYEEKLSEKEIYWIKKLNTLDNGYNQTEGGEGIYNYTTAVLQYDIDGKFIREWDSIKSANIELNVNSNSVSGIPRVCLGLSKIAFGFQWHYKKTNKYPRKISPAPSDYWVLQYDKLGNFLNEFRSPTIAAEMIGVKNGGSKISECARNDYLITAYGYQWKYKEEDGILKKIQSATELNGLLKHYAKTAKPVIQYDLEGNFVNTFRTTDEAEEITGISRVTIQKVASGEYYHAGNFQWKYKMSDNYPKKIAPYTIPQSKIVFQYDPKSGNLVGSWNSAREACRKNSNWNYKQISSAANGIYQKTYLGYVWSYKELTLLEIKKRLEKKVKSRETINKKLTKTIYQYTKNKSTFIQEFVSAAEAARTLGYKNGSGINKVLRGERNHCKGFYYSFIKIDKDH
ncbi:MAG: GIY-YIG nuclease family protein [Balneolaceae bacterium]|nr:GIY-YIG nuclease family protein [Balneolaceae bacterium]